MFVFAWRALAATAAAAALVAGWFATNFAQRDTEVVFGRVLDGLADAKTLHVKLTQAGRTGEAWIAQAGLFRWNLPDGTYQVARGKRVWLVDEKANRAASRPSAIFGSEKPRLDTLALLGLPEPKDREALLKSRPERVERDGAAYDVYRIAYSCPEGKIHIEAVVDPATQLLRSLETDVDRDGKITPLATLTVLGVDQPVREELFVVGDTLTEDGRIGKVTDLQGIVCVKPVMAARWSPVDEGLLLKPGDWLQTDVRGANAATARLMKDTRVTVGPGTTVELIKPNQLRLSIGELKIAADEKAPVELLGPGKEKVEVKGTAIYRVVDEKLVIVKKPPEWLGYYEGTTTKDTLGSLVAKIDGRNTPLTVGYHKVTVDIRDQIARTVIEESFVNRTDGRLEGVFHFPLPQDASISGFGMWIGDELVEADVVEKQRAREIYEIILSEKRDPGLLEWSGGNIFKARVFPIEPHSEKKIKITYTQVLPLKGNSYRYSYALQSDLLKQHPLRELGIDVKINSAVPLAAVACPTHTARIDKTRHSGHVEFAAQEYTPTRDFEVVVDVDGRQSDVVLVPHRRGDDGYFMLLVGDCPNFRPGENGTVPFGAEIHRDLVPDGEPLDLLVLADTSASLSAGDRKVQAEFLAALLSSLTPRDQINLACCDVECDWAFEKSAPADAKNIDAVRDFLAKRVSLGWSDLDKAFASALSRCGPKTRVVYIGDGVPTTGDTDPAAFAKRLRRLGEGKPGTFYAVSVGSGFESGVLKAIASLGGGSVRQIGGELGPVTAARELLAEIARPAVRDLKVEFRGLRTARVYPAELPNIAAGTQQIILGRYLPEGRDQQGEVIVTGMQGDKPVRFAAQVSLRDAEQGNSFIPRLWARMHLDQLLQQGALQAIQDEIIGLSEEYHIMTPYTSLLVLESDADRERFKVKRRFQMRDGEKFFAQGRDNSNYELVQQQMKRAGSWRLNLRRAALAQFSGLGRDPRMFQPQAVYGDYNGRLRGINSYSGGTFVSGGRLGGSGGVYLGDAWDVGNDRLGALSSLAECAPDGTFSFSGTETAYATSDSSRGDFSWHGEADMPVVHDPLSREEDGRFEKRAERLAKEDFWDGEGERFEDSKKSLDFDGSDKDLAGYDGPFAPRGSVYYDSNATAPYPVADLVLPINSPVSHDWYFSNGATMTKAGSGFLSLGRKNQAGAYEYGWRESGRYRRGPGHMPSYDMQWLATLFPAIPPAPAKEPQLKQRWPAGARAIADSLLRTAQLAKLQGGLAVESQSENFDAETGEMSYLSQSLALVGTSQWLLRAQADGSQSTVQWCDAKERGILGLAFQLGRVRASDKQDLAAPPLGLGGYVLSSLERTYSTYSVELRPQGEDRTLLVLTHPSSPNYEIHVLVDTRRHVLLSVEHRSEGKVTSTERYGDFVEAAGCWWATRIESINADGKITSRTMRKFTDLKAAELDARIKQELACKDAVQLLREPGVKVADAKRADAAGKATFDDQITLLMHFAFSQQWTRVMEHLEQAERLSAGKPGMRWIRDALLNASRRREELKKRIFEEAAEMVKRATEAEGATEGDSPIFAGAKIGTVPGAKIGTVPDALFLAEYLYNQSSNILEGNEMLALLDALKPVYQRQPARVQAMRRWTQNRVNYLNNVGRSDEALQLQRQLAVDFPRDHGLQENYAQALANSGDYDAACAWIKQALAGAVKWQPYQADSLRNGYARFLENQQLYPELLAYISEWMKQNPESGSACSQYLSVLVRLNRLDEINVLVRKWMKEAQVAGKLPPAAALRLEAAVSLALGQGHNLYTNRLDEQWLKPLAETVLFFARHEFQYSTADRIMQHWQFTQSDECRGVRKAVAGILLDEIGKLPPHRVERFVGWISANDPVVEQEVWKRLADALEKRWSAEPKADIKHQLGGALVQVLSRRTDVKELLAFLRRQRQKGPPEYRTQYAQQLFDTLLGQPWSAAHEDELFSLMDKLSDAEEPFAQLVSQVTALHRLTDALVNTRYQDKLKELKNPEKLTRTELRAKQGEYLKAAREGFAQRLDQARAKAAAELAPWLTVERLYLDVLLDRNLKKVAEECWEVVGPRPVKLGEDVQPKDLLAAVLRNRCLLTLCNLAVRKDADAALVDKLLTYIDAGMAMDKEDSRWRLLKYELLVALDRPKALEEALRTWIAGDGPENRWRVSLGYLLAEQGKLPEAIKLFQAVAAADELGPAEYRAMADWHMATNDRGQYEAAMIGAFKVMPENQLQNLLNQKVRPWQQSDGKLPSELDRDVLLIFAAALEKTGNPQNYTGTLQQFYRGTRDFRLLESVSDAAVGHTAGYVYPLLGGMSSLLTEVRDEATADSIVEQLVKVRRRAKTEVDHRALDLLELLVERRAAELLNQPGPHVQKALSALQRAFKRKWSDGEPRLMAQFLENLGAISQPKLAEEQLRQLRSLHAEAAKGSVDRLYIARHLAGVLWGYSRSDEAVDIVQAALDEHQEAAGGVLPVSCNDVLGTFISYLESRRHFARGEKYLFEQLKHPANPPQALWLTLRLYQLYENAVANDGDVSLGRGATLYAAVRDKLLKDLAALNHDHRRALVERLCSLWTTAHNKRIGDAAADLRAFAFQRFPQLLKQHPAHHQSLVGTVAGALYHVVGPRDGIRLLVESIESEPGWLRYNNNDGWQRHGGTLAYWRTLLKEPLGDLEPRLLKIVLKELRLELQTRQSRNRQMYWQHYSYYWKEKEADFLAVADEVWAERKKSGAAVVYIAEYMYHGLGRHNRAIEILLIAYRDKLLDENGQARLVQFLHERQRFGESLAILQAMIERWPDNLTYRTQLMHAYFRTQQPKALLGLLEQTDEHFHKNGRWTEAAMAGLGYSCLENELFAQSVKYYNEAIPLHQRTQPRRGIGNGTLSQYYGYLARAYAGLKKTAEAVDAACSAIVSWGPRHDRRAEALTALRDVLVKSPDLDAYVAQLNEQSEETGQDKPIVRKALGQVFLEKKQYDKARAQLQIAGDLQPNDTEIHQALVACCDAQGDKEGAVRQLLQSLRLSRRDIKLYEDLGRRLGELKQPTEAERAYTSTVEMLPAESESHSLLAEIRQTQNRWPEAIVQWEQVARIRALEPTGLLRLAAAQIHEKQWDAARDTLKKLNARAWPGRFSNVENEIRQLQQQVEQGAKK